MTTHDDIELLLSDYFSDRLSQKDCEAVEKWIGDSRENHDIALRHYKIWQSAACLSDDMDRKTENALKKTHRKMKIALWKSRILKIQKAASMLLLPLAIATGYYAYMYYNAYDCDYVEVRTTTGMVSCITLPDSSKVWLNSNSSLRYPTRFIGRNRNVSLKGEAFFDVEKHRGRTFCVTAEGMKIEVLGTEFNIEAYPDRGRELRTTLLSGSVGVTYCNATGQEQKDILSPGEQLSYNPERRTSTTRIVNPRTVSSWKDGHIILENTPLQEALRMIENRYNVKFLIRNNALLSNHYTGVFVDQSLDVILEHFKKTTKISFDKNITQVSDGETISGRQIIIVQ